MNKYALTNARVIDTTNGTDSNGLNVLVDGGVIEGITSDNNLSSNYKLIDTKGMVVTPSFIDLHTHLRESADGQNADSSDQEGVQSGTKAAAKGGYTTICAMPNTTPALDTLARFEKQTELVKRKSEIEVLLYSAITKNREGLEKTDWSALAEAGVVGFSDDGDCLMSEEILDKILKFTKDKNVFLSNHAEEKSMVEGGAVNDTIAQTLGMRARPRASEESIVRRDIECAKKLGAHIHIPHVSSKGSVGLIKNAKDEGVDITAEVNHHHLFFSEEDVLRDENNTNLRVNPPLRGEKDRKALVQGLKEGVIDVVATDHAPHKESDKRSSFSNALPGMSGIETSFPVLNTLVSRGEITLLQVLKALSEKPAKILKKSASLVARSEANLVVLDTQKRWVLKKEELLSKGKNTPLDNQTLFGKVVLTMYKGKVVYNDNVFV